MKDIYSKVGGDKTAIKQNQTISMAEYKGDVQAIWSCNIDSHIDINGNHIESSTSCSVSHGSKANTTAAITVQKDITGVSFFALSIQEIAEAYNASVNVSRHYRRAKYAECGNENKNIEDTYNGTTVLAAYYWLRSPGYRSTLATSVDFIGLVGTDANVAQTTLGARPACYATLA
jgi:hypothetical protein